MPDEDRTALRGGARPGYLPLLDVIRVVAVLGVVGVHVLAGAEEAGADGTGLLTVDMALVAAVPAFFMISGALGLDPRAQRDGAGAFLRRRAARILPALVVWSALCILVIRVGLLRTPTDLRDVVSMVVTGTTAPHLYFLFALAGLVLLTPVIQPFLAPDEGRRAWILGLGACAWTVAVMAVGRLAEAGVLSTVPIELGTSTFFLVYLGYYVLGRAVLVAPVPRRLAVALLAASPAWVALLVVLYRWAATGDGGAAAAVLSPAYVTAPVMAYSVGLVAAVVSLGRDWRVGEVAARRLRRAGEATFGVYLVHYPVLVLLRELVPGLNASTAGALLGLWVFTAVISAGFALLAMRVPGLRRVV